MTNRGRARIEIGLLEEMLKKTKLPEYRTLGCYATKNRSLWCNQLCKPKGENALGLCGRLAPHSVKGRTQKAIQGHIERTGNAGN